MPVDAEGSILIMATVADVMVATLNPQFVAVTIDKHS